MTSTKSIPVYIDLAICLFILPALILLLPIEKWLDQNSNFVFLLVFWLYAVYILNRTLTVPMLFKKRQTVAIGILILIGTIVVTYFITNMQIDEPFGHFRDDIMRERGDRGTNITRGVPRQKLHQFGIWFLYIVAVSFSLIVGLLTVLFKQRVEQQEIEFEKDRAQLALYRAQINPHFLFNTLNSLYGLIISKSERAETAFMQFINLMKYMYTNGTKDKIDIESEINYINEYITLQQQRLNENTKVEFTHNIDATNSKNLTISPMLLITFVENAFKYGVSAQDKTLIAIDIDITDNELKLNIQNSIITQPNSNQPTGIGIANCKKRLALLYPNRHTLKIASNNNQYSVTLKIKLI